MFNQRFCKYNYFYFKCNFLLKVTHFCDNILSKGIYMFFLNNLCYLRERCLLKFDYEEYYY